MFKSVIEYLALRFLIFLFCFFIFLLFLMLFPGTSVQSRNLFCLRNWSQLAFRVFSLVKSHSLSPTTLYKDNSLALEVVKHTKNFHWNARARLWKIIGFVSTHIQAENQGEKFNCTHTVHFTKTLCLITVVNTSRDTRKRRYLYTLHLWRGLLTPDMIQVKKAVSWQVIPQ